MDLKDKFINGVESLCLRCNFKPTPWDLEAYVACFEGRWEEGIKALKLAFMRIKPQNGMPSPHDLLSLLGEVAPNAPTSRDAGTEAANAILSAVRVYGGYQAVEARKSIGGHLWRIVEAMGGWEVLCMIEIDSLPTWRAQIRDAAEGFSKNDYFKGNELGPSKISELLHNLSTGMDLKI